MPNGSNGFESSVEELLRKAFGGEEEAARELQTAIGRRKLKAEVNQFVRTMDAETLGRTAAQGKGLEEDLQDNDVTMYEVHRSNWLAQFGSGITLLHEIAAAALIARAYERTKIHQRTTLAGARR